MSLANQNLPKALAIKDVHLFLNLYLDLPVWALFFVPPRNVGKSLVYFIETQRRWYDVWAFVVEIVDDVVKDNAFKSFYVEFTDLLKLFSKI